MTTDIGTETHTGAGAGGDAGADSAAEEWRSWHERRTATVAAPYGPLALVGTHWLADHPEGRLPGVPGLWREDGDGEGEHEREGDGDGDGAGVVLSAADGDGLTADGRPLTGEIRLTADSGPFEASRIAAGEHRLVVLRREGLWAVRDVDPGSAARRTFRGIEAMVYDAEWELPGRFRPYDESRTVLVENADGRERGLGLGGEIAFSVGGTEHTLQVAVEADGSLWAVFADATSGKDSYRFRFLRPAAPAEDGTVTVDFNRALLPPCAFADHFICPFPPPGNTLPIPVPAGERTVVG